MKILIVSTYDLSGGASLAAFRLHEALLTKGVNSQMLVEKKTSNLESVITVDKNSLEKKIGIFTRLWRKIINTLPLFRYHKTRIRTFGAFSTQKASNCKVVKKINKLNPDIVHLNWICKGFLSIKDISRIKPPIVWNFHDMWAITGGCHCVYGKLYDESINCEEYMRNCGKCGILGSNKYKDLSYYIIQKKKKTYSKVKDMIIVGLSRWITDCAKKSAVFSNKKIVNIPNTINTQIFKPLNKEVCRDFWNLPKDKKLILFGAVSAISRAYKGYDLLTEALFKLDRQDFECVVFGANEPKNSEKFDFKINYLGNITNTNNLVKLYSACDVTVAPSRRDNLSNVILESLSCATPVVCFNIGGNSDMVEHKINGFIAKAFDTNELATGIEWVLNNVNYADLQKNGRQKIANEFDNEIVVNKYIKLYKELIVNEN